MKKIILLIIICALVLISSCENSINSINLINSENTTGADFISAPDTKEHEIYNNNISPERYLICKHTDITEFNRSIQNPKEFEVSKNIIGGIVPHHMAAATLISGFFKSVSDMDMDYDTVVILAPNHAGETGDIVFSYKNWQAQEAVYCDKDIIEGVYKRKPDGCVITENDDRMEAEHSVSVLIPYINYYLPETKVAAFILSRRLSLESVYNFTQALYDEVKDRKVLFISSVDFSHFLTPALAYENDRITEAAIISGNYRDIHNFSNNYVDSPQALNAFLMCFSNLEILYNTDASEFLGPGIDETTSYFIIAAYE